MPTLHSVFRRRTNRAPGLAIDTEIVAAVALLTAVLVVGLSTAADYGLTVDEYNADDYGPKALAWYTSGFIDRSHFETVEFSLWYYGPWFHMLTAYVQSFDLADRFTVRHAMTFMVGLAGVAALLPIGRLAVGRWAGLAAIVLCLMTGYFYGSLFFTPIDVPFLAAMTWATLAILVMTRRELPSWPATTVAGLLTGLAIGTRTGGIITHAYLLGAMILCAAEFFGDHGRLTARYMLQIGARFAAVVVLAWLTAIVLWPWLQIGNPFAAVQDRARALCNDPDVVRFLRTGASGFGPTPCRSPTFRPSFWPGCRELFFLLLAVALGYAIVASAVRRARHRREMAARSRAPACVPRRWRWRASAACSSSAPPSCCRSGFSSFSARSSTTASGMCCSSFPCWRSWPAPAGTRCCRCCAGPPWSPPSSRAPMSAASSRHWRRCIRSNTSR